MCEYSAILGMADVFMKICNKKSAQYEYLTEKGRLGDSIFVVSEPEDKKIVQFHRYSISYDTWVLMDVNIPNIFDAYIHCVEGHLYVFSNERDSLEVKVNI